MEKSFQKLVLRVSSGFQTLENNNTTRPAASWFQMFSRVWKPDETLALVFEIVQSIPSIFCWVCAAGFSEPLPYFSLLWPIRDPIFVRFWARSEWNGSHQEPYYGCEAAKLQAPCGL